MTHSLIAANTGDPSVKGAVHASSTRLQPITAQAVHASGAELEKMVQMAKLQGTEIVLDAGCGPGHTALAFAPHVAKVVAVDLSRSMLNQGGALAAGRGITNIEFRQADVEQLPFEPRHSYHRYALQRPPLARPASCITRVPPRPRRRTAGTGNS